MKENVKIVLLCLFCGTSIELIIYVDINQCLHVYVCNITKYVGLYIRITDLHLPWWQNPDNTFLIHSGKEGPEHGFRLSTLTVTLFHFSLLKNYKSTTFVSVFIIIWLPGSRMRSTVIWLPDSDPDHNILL